MSRRSKGKPHTFATAKKLQTAVDSYLLSHKEHPTISGLALSLGYADRQSIYDLLKQNDSYSCIIKQAITFIESVFEEHLHRAAPTQGAQFWLRVHSNAKATGRQWCDQQQVDMTSAGKSMPISIVINKTETANALEAAVQDADADGYNA